MKRFNMIVMFSSDKRKILFCKRKKPPYLGLLNLVGGKVEASDKTSESAALRELEEETGIGREHITNLHRLLDLTYYDTGRLIEVYVCRLKDNNTKVVEEDGGNPLVWVDVIGTNFNDLSMFGGDGNIFHIIRMATKRQPYRVEGGCNG